MKLFHLTATWETTVCNVNAWLFRGTNVYYWAQSPVQLTPEYHCNNSYSFGMAIPLPGGKVYVQPWDWVNRQSRNLTQSVSDVTPSATTAVYLWLLQATVTINSVPNNWSYQLWNDFAPSLSLIPGNSEDSPKIAINTNRNSFFVWIAPRNSSVSLSNVRVKPIQEIAVGNQVKYSCLNGQCVPRSLGPFNSLEECQQHCKPIDGTPCNCPPPSICLSPEEALELYRRLKIINQIIE